jgi:hypothetical protein
VSVADHCRKNVVTIREDVCHHDDRFTGGALDGEASAIDRGTNVLDDDAQRSLRRRVADGGPQRTARRRRVRKTQPVAD